MSSKKSEGLRFFKNREKRPLETKTFELPRITKFLPHFYIITVGTHKQLVALIRVPDLSGLLRSIKFCNWKNRFFSIFWKKFYCYFFVSTLCHASKPGPNGIWFECWHVHNMCTKPTNQDLSTPSPRSSQEDQIWDRGQKWPFFTIFWTYIFLQPREGRGSHL